MVATSGATINPGSSPGVLTFSNNLTLGGGVTNAFELANDLTVGGGINDLIVVGGNLNLSGTNTLLFTPGTPPWPAIAAQVAVLTAIVLHCDEPLPLLLYEPVQPNDICHGPVSYITPAV